MAKDFSIIVGTLGMGLWQSPDGGQSWARGKLWHGYQGGRSTFGLAVHPSDSRVIFAGTDEGLYRSEDRGKNFEHISSAMDELKVWRIAIDPTDPSIMFAGTAPARVFRSRDGGLHWDALDVPFSDDCFNVNVPRVLGLEVDPTDHRIVWAGVEVGGMCRSRDGGDTWTRISGGVMDELDVHDITVVPGRPAAAIVTLPNDLTLTEDGGEHWRAMGAGPRFPLPYCRSVVFKEGDPSVMFAAVGDDALGCLGTIQRSRDGGEPGRRLCCRWRRILTWSVSPRIHRTRISFWDAATTANCLAARTVVTGGSSFRRSSPKCGARWPGRPTRDGERRTADERQTSHGRLATGERQTSHDSQRRASDKRKTTDGHYSAVRRLSFVASSSLGARSRAS